MRRFRKWVLTLAILGMTPGLALAGLPSFLHMPSDKSQMQAIAHKNQQIAEEIASALRTAHLTGYDIQIQFERGVATLTGKIPNADQKSRVGEVVSKIHGVKRVENQIVVRSPMSSSPATTTRTEPKTLANLNVPKPFTGVRNFASLFKKPSAKPSERPVHQQPRVSKLQQASLEQPSAAKQPTNQELATQVASALKSAQLTSTGIDIEVRNGTVTLTGNTVDAEQKAKVAQIVSSLPGVQSVNNQLAVIDNTKFQRLAMQVASALESARLTSTGIDIEVRNGTVTLMGKTVDAEQKAKASQIVSSLPGVQSVNNQLVVVDDTKASAEHSATKPMQALAAQEPTPTFKTPVRRNPQELGSRRLESRMSNQEVAERIAAALKASGLVGHGIEIRFKDGVATLAGQIANPEQQQEALRRIAQVPGVKTVKNSFTLLEARPAKPGTPPTLSHQATRENPQAVAQQIAQAMESTQLRGHDITVRYQNGKAILLGSVSSPEQLPYATQLAMSVPGVQMVDNRLSVPGTPTMAPGDPFAVHQPLVNPRQTIPKNGSLDRSNQIPNSMLPVAMPMSASAIPGIPRKADPVSTTLVSTQMPPQPVTPPSYGHPGSGASHSVYNMPHLPTTAWPAYASYPNYAQVTYPKEYSASAWPYIGPFYPYPQIPLGWRKVQMEWDDGYWNINFRPRTGKWWWFLNPENW